MENVSQTLQTAQKQQPISMADTVAAMGNVIDTVVNAAADYINKVKEVRRRINKVGDCALQAIARYYSNTLGEDVSIERTKLLLQAQLAIFSILVTAGTSLLLCIGCTAWFGNTLLKLHDME